MCQVIYSVSDNIQCVRLYTVCQVIYSESDNIQCVRLYRVCQVSNAKQRKESYYLKFDLNIKCGAS